jgi:putrescine transport system substrate-binding protein
MRNPGLKLLAVIALLLVNIVSVQAQAARTLRILNWADYIDPDIIREFEQNHQVTVEYVPFTNVDEFSTLLFDHRNQFDLVFPPTRMVNILSANGYLKNIDSERLPEKQDIRAHIINDYYQQDDGALNALPYMWGTTGLGVNTRKLKELGLVGSENSWALLFDPVIRKKAAQCGIGLLNERDELFAAALLYLGYSANTLNHEQLNEAGLLLKDTMKDVSYLHTARFRQDLVDGKLCVAVGYSGDLLTEFARTHDLAYFIPKEGAAIRMVAMAIPENAPAPDLAYQFMEYLMRGDVAARNSAWLYSPSVMASATQYVSPEILANPAIYPEVSSLHQMETLSPRDRKTNRYVHRLWVEALCSGRSWCAVPMSSEF